MTENSENLHMSFLCPIDWHIFFPGGFDNFNANQDTLLYIVAASGSDEGLVSLGGKLHP